MERVRVLALLLREVLLRASDVRAQFPEAMCPTTALYLALASAAAGIGGVQIASGRVGPLKNGRMAPHFWLFDTETGTHIDFTGYQFAPLVQPTHTIEGMKVTLLTCLPPAYVLDPPKARQQARAYLNTFERKQLRKYLREAGVRAFLGGPMPAMFRPPGSVIR